MLKFAGLASLALLVAALVGLIEIARLDVTGVTPVSGMAVMRYRIDPSSSTFIAHAHRGGLAWFKGKDHFIAVRNYSGEASLTLDVLNPASLAMTIQVNSLEETGAHFTAQQKGIIKKELDEIVIASDAG